MPLGCSGRILTRLEEKGAFPYEKTACTLTEHTRTHGCCLVFACEKQKCHKHAHTATSKLPLSILLALNF